MDKGICARPNCSAQEYTDAMTLSGTKVEGYKEFDKNLDKIIVGKINKIEKHPDGINLLYARYRLMKMAQKCRL